MTSQTEQTSSLIVRIDRSAEKVSIVDPAGGIWWATEEAAEAILAHESPETEALRMMEEDRSAGQWHD